MRPLPVPGIPQRHGAAERRDHEPDHEPIAPDLCRHSDHPDPRVGRPGGRVNEPPDQKPLPKWPPPSGPCDPARGRLGPCGPERPRVAAHHWAAPVHCSFCGKGLKEAAQIIASKGADLIQRRAWIWLGIFFVAPSVARAAPGSRSRNPCRRTVVQFHLIRPPRRRVVPCCRASGGIRQVAGQQSGDPAPAGRARAATHFGGAGAAGVHHRGRGPSAAAATACMGLVPPPRCPARDGGRGWRARPRAPRPPGGAAPPDAFSATSAPAAIQKAL